MVSELQPKTDFVPAEEQIVDDLETLKVLADPLRLRIRELMGKPATVKQVAARLELPPTKLYYHINLLEKHGLIVLVNTRLVSGIVEKHYQVSAYRTRVAKQLLSVREDPDGEGLSLAINSIFESTRSDLMQSVRDGVVNWDEEGEGHKGLIMHTSRICLNDEQAAEFYLELRQLFTRYEVSSKESHERGAGNVYRMLQILFPVKHSIEDEK